MRSILFLSLTLVNIFVPTKALYPFKLIHNASHAISLSPEQWVSEFECTNSSEALDINGTIERSRECDRDKNAWIFKHIDEVHEDFKFLVHQRSIDERFADSVYLANAYTGMDFHHYIFNSGSPDEDKLNIERVAGHDVDKETCKRHLNAMVELLDDLSSRVAQLRQLNETETPNSADNLAERHFRLARILDSFGRYESGQMAGRYHSYGMYQQCISTPLQIGNELVDSRYCWARLNLDNHLSRSLKGLPSGNSSQIVSFFPGDFKFHMAVCLPKSCHSINFELDADRKRNLRLVQRLLDSQLKMPKSMYLDESLPLESVFCLVDEETRIARLPPAGWALIAVTVLWFALCIYATLIGGARRQIDRNEISTMNSEKPTTFWSHLDLSVSWSDFLGHKELARHGDRVNLDPLNFVKCLCTLLVVLAHAYVLAGPLTLAHISLTAFMETTHLESLSLFGFVMVDSFFVITGMMMVYIFLKRVTAYEKRQLVQQLNQHQLEQLQPIQTTATSTTSAGTQINAYQVIDLSDHDKNLDWQFSPLGMNYYRACFMLTLNRYLRLVPLFVLAFWFSKKVYPHLGSGPMWDYGLNKETSIGGCLRETWLTPFTFLSAHLPAAKQCLPQTWTISNDLFFSLVMPPVIVLLYRWPKSAFTLATFVVLSSLYLGRVTYEQLAPSIRFELEQLRDHSVALLFQIASYLYTTPLSRLPAIAMGIFSGYFLFEYSQSGRGSFNDSNGRANSTAARLSDIKELENGESDGKLRFRLYKWPWWFTGPLTYLCSLVVLFIFVTSLLTPEFRRLASPESKRAMTSYLHSYYHLVWSAANSVIFLRLVTDLNNNSVTRIFSSKFFSTLGKLSYAILLIHWYFLMFQIHSQTQASDFSRPNYLASMALAYCASLPLAVIVFVVIENPVDKLTKTYLLRNKV